MITSFLFTLLAFIVAISLLVVVHEFGHFSVARFFGVKVDTFSIGFGKALAKWKDKKGTEYIIASIPLGGYVKMADSQVDNLSPQELPYAFNHKPILQRALIVLAGPVANFIFSFFIYWIIFMMGVPHVPAIVEKITPDSIISYTKIHPGAELKSIGAIKVESWKDVSLALLQQLGKNNVTITYRPKDQQQVDFVDINISRWTFDPEKENPALSLGFIPKPPEVLPIIQQVLKDSPAAQSGLQKNDTLLKINEKIITSWDHFAEQIKLSPNKMMLINIERDKKSLNFTLTPNEKTNLSGQIEGFAGIVPLTDVIIQRYNVSDAALKAVTETKNIIKMTVRSFWLLLTGKIDLKNLSGPVTIAKVAGESANYGLLSFLNFLGFISISLGVVNLVPLPILDGGRLLLLLIEKVKGRPLSIETQGHIYRVGIILLLLLMGLTFFNDLSRL